MSSEDKTSKKATPKLISDLPYTTLKRLGDRLDLPCEGNQVYWRRLVSEWAGSPYDQLTIERFAMNANRLDGSPAYSLLTDMSNRGVSYSHLVSLLKKISHHTALHELGYRGGSCSDLEIVYNILMCVSCLQRKFGSLGTHRQLRPSSVRG